MANNNGNNTFVPKLRAMLSSEVFPSRYFVTADSFISKEYLECCPIKYAPPYRDSFLFELTTIRGAYQSARTPAFLYFCLYFLSHCYNNSYLLKLKSVL